MSWTVNPSHRSVNVARSTNTQYSWKFFTYQWNNAAPGEHTIVSRATDANGVVQPEEADLADKKTLRENNGQFVRRFAIS